VDRAIGAQEAFDAANPGKRYGVGFACVQKDFGNGAETSMAAIDLSPEGRLSLRHMGVEMGTGTATSQAVVCAQWLGRPADEIQTAVLDWPDLPLKTSGADPHTLSQAEQDLAARDPEWTPEIISPSRASNSAYYFSHATREAARVIFVHGLWPAALSIWGEGFGGGQSVPYVVRREDARWIDAGLTANGLEPLSLERLAKRAHALGLVTGATVHCFNRWAWTTADFEIDGASERLPLDGLALRYGTGAAAAQKAAMANAGGSHRIERRNVAYPPTQRGNAGVVYYTPVAALAAVAVHLASGKVEVLTHHSIMECGTAIVPALVSGQLEGGIAMGIGHALHEFLPLYEDGPGDGTWNFNRYTVPRASDVAVWSQTAEILPPLSDSDPPKGVAEVVMIPIVAAVMNAIAHAIGHRFRDMPVSAEKIRKVLA
jgi:CO/xanthine dehydrogenase Mo-binding subunit